MWPENAVTRMLNITYPIIQAPMAGGPTTPALVAAVANAGGLGMLGAGYMTPEQIRVAITEIRDQTERPFGVNLLMPPVVEASAEELARANALLRPYRDALGITEPPAPARYAESFDAQVAVLLEERVPVCGFAFGMPASELVAELRQRGIPWIGMATTVREAVALEANGAPLIVAQGSEAGAHRGTFLGAFEDALVGTMALVPQVTRAVRVPVLAAGGIMDGRGMVAALALGADGVQMGTAFLTCAESGAHPLQKAAILASSDESTAITRAFSGRPARGIHNQFLDEMAEVADEVPAYPIQNALTRDIRQAAARQNRAEFLSLWSGQAGSLARTLRAEELMRTLVREVEETLSRLQH